MQCNAITSGGDRCKLDATSGSYCWSHAPENAEERKRRARRGGKARGASELSEVKREIRAVVSDVLEGRVERGVGAVVFQGFNCLLKAVEVEKRIRDQDELLARLEALEASRDERSRGGNRWGA